LTQTAHSKLKLAALAVLVLVSIRALVSYCIVRSGFRALSDDDYSRVVIAESFVDHPSWDPSGTSWLPFPFWFYGTCLKLVGVSLAKARIIAFASGLLSAAGVWTAGRWLGHSRSASLLGGIIACALPYAAWLGVATTPDYFSAVLVLLGCCSLARKSTTIRLFGALAIIVATLSRYEAWPVAVTWSVLCMINALRSRNWKFAILSLLVLTPPLAWMLHGVVQHHSALFFVKRVVSYRRALGLDDTSAISRLLATPRHLFQDAPELWAIAGIAMLVAAWLKISLVRRRWTGPLLAILSIVAFLSIGDWRNGTATHHVGRTLLAPWSFVALITAAHIVSVVRAVPWLHRVAGSALLAVLCGFVYWVVRPTWTSVDSFSPRREETEIGAIAASKIAPGRRLAILTPDYGYFAVEAALGRPVDVVIIDAHDPRRPDPANIFASDAQLSASLHELGAHWLIAPLKHENALLGFGRIHYRGPSLLLAELR